MQSSPDNAAIAERLEAFAGLLDLSGSGYYTARAYRRAAETIHSYHNEVLQELFRDLGGGLEGPQSPNNPQKK